MAVDRGASFAVLLREHRRRAGLSQRELAERAGLGVTTVRDLEQGRTQLPQPHSARALATALELGEDAAAALHDTAVAQHTASAQPAAQEHGLVRLDVLGPLTLRRGSAEVALGRGGRRVVLARLALSANAPVPVHELVYLLWGDRPPPDPHQLLQSYVSRLRSALAPHGPGRPAEGQLTLGTGGYQLVLAEQQLDVAEFRALVRTARRADPPDAVDLLDDALRLWRDASPLADVFELRDHPLVTALVQEHVTVALQYADLTARLGAHGRSLPRLRQLAAAHPLHEPLHARLVTALAGAGLQADALSAYDTIRRCLADGLGIDPGPELTEVHQRVLRQEVKAASAAPVGGRPVPAQLPAGTNGFVGRREELAQLDKLLDTGAGTNTAVISAVSGMAGVGKTTLAVHWARTVADRFPDGQFYVNLRGFDPAGAAATPAEVVRSFLDALNVPAQQVPAGLDAQTALYRSLLADRRILVLLDNARDVEQVRPLLPGTPGCLVLITSRNQLTGLIASAGAVPLPLDLLTADESRDLLARRLGMDRITAEPAVVDEIIERCARLPLALAIAGARAAIQSERPLGTVAAELRHPHDRLDTLATGDGGTDVRSVFSWSYQQLSRPAARLFRLLSVHPGPDLSVSAAASLAGITPAQVRPTLAELVRANLVTEPVPGRYTLHDLLRAYAGELAASSEPEADRQATIHRLLDHYLQSAHQAAIVCEPNRDAIEAVAPLAGVTVHDVESASAATDWFTAEYQTLTAAIRLAVDAGLDRHAWQLVWSIVPFLDRHRGFRDAVARHHIALEAARRLDDPAAQGFSLHRLGRVYTMLGEHNEAQAHLEHALEVYRQLRDDTHQAHVHTALADTLERQGRHRDALHHAEQALAQVHTSGRPSWKVEALNAVGWCHARLGDYETALEYCEPALALAQEVGYRQGEAGTLDSLGVAYHHLGRYADAVTAYQQALAVFRAFGNRYNEAETLANLGDTYHANGDTGTAHHTWRTALAILADINHPDAGQIRARLLSGDAGAPSAGA